MFICKHFQVNNLRKMNIITCKWLIILTRNYLLHKIWNNFFLHDAWNAVTPTPRSQLFQNHLITSIFIGMTSHRENWAPRVLHKFNAGTSPLPRRRRIRCHTNPHQDKIIDRGQIRNQWIQQDTNKGQTCQKD